MEKIYTLVLDEYLLDLIDRPIRTHNDCVKVLLNVIKYWQISAQLEIGEEVGRVTVSVSKTSRLFIEKRNCIYSIQLPFLVKNNEEDNLPIFSSAVCGDITNQLVSKALSLLELDLVKSDCISDLADEVMTIAESLPGFWSFFWSLLSFESGYLRYDFDEKNEDGLLHPLHHFDIFFSSNSTFKVGLDGPVKLELLSDIVNRETNCHFLVRK